MSLDDVSRDTIDVRTAVDIAARAAFGGRRKLYDDGDDVCATRETRVLECTGGKENLQGKRAEGKVAREGVFYGRKHFTRVRPLRG